MGEQSFCLGAIDGIRIIPAEDVPAGFKRTVGADIFVNAQNYEYMRPLSARATITAVGMLREMVLTKPVGEERCHDVTRG